MKVDCAACHHVAPLTPAALLRLGRSPAAKVLDLRAAFGVAGAEREWAGVSVKWDTRG
jgi:hypothetical protein